MERLYFLVWNPETGQTRHRHENLEQAEAEAARLAKNHRGSEFVVLAPIASHKAVDTVRTKFEPHDEIPF